MKYICEHQGKISRTCGWNILVNFCCLLSLLLSKHPQPTAMRRHLPLISTIQVPASGFKHEYQHFTVIITMRQVRNTHVGGHGGSGNRVTWAQNVYASHLIWHDGALFTTMRNWCIRTNRPRSFLFEGFPWDLLQTELSSNSAIKIRWGREGFLVKLSQKKRQRDVI